MKGRKNFLKALLICSPLLLVASSLILFTITSSLIAMLPIIIPIIIATFGFPAYAIIKNTKDHLEKKDKANIIEEQRSNENEFQKSINKENIDKQIVIQNYYNNELDKEEVKIKRMQLRK